MKKIIIFTLMIFVFITGCNEKPNFRNIHWGMTYYEVQRSEHAHYLYGEEGKAIAYDGISYNMIDADVMYSFDFLDGGCSGAGVFFKRVLTTDEINIIIKNISEDFGDEVEYSKNGQDVFTGSYKNLVNKNYNYTYGDEMYWNGDDETVVYLYILPFSNNPYKMKIQYISREFLAEQG